LKTADPAPHDDDGGRRLDAFIRIFDGGRNTERRLFPRIEAAYGAVEPTICTDADVRIFTSLLYHAMRFFRPRVVVQTGTATGATAVSSGFGLSDNRYGVLFTIDPEPARYFGVENPVVIARKAVDRAGLQRQVRFVRGYSTIPLDFGRLEPTGAPRWRMTQLLRHVAPDMLIIDGDHTCLGCYLDLEYGAAGLAADGPRLIICHDYLSIFEVRRAVRLWIERAKPRYFRLIRSRCGLAMMQY
jgi:hypothetical protein